MKKQQLKLVETPKLDNTPKTLTFDEGVTIQCGASSITLTPEGDIVLRGKRLLQKVEEDITLSAKNIRLGT